MNKTSKYISSSSSSSLDSLQHNRNSASGLWSRHERGGSGLWPMHERGGRGLCPMHESWREPEDGHRKRNVACGQWHLQGHVREGDQEQWRYVRLGCKRWTCPHCGPKKAKRLRRAIITAAEGNKLTRLLTLTLDPASCPAEESIPYIRGNWNKFRTSLKRHTGASISFITVVELQKSGYAHLHVLIDRFIDQKWISAAWEAVGGGKIVDIRHVDIHRITSYLSKYLTKTMLLADFSKRQRRYTTSRDIVLFVKSSTGTWILQNTSVDVAFRFLNEICSKAVSDPIYDEQGVLQSFRTSRSDTEILKSRLRDAGAIEWADFV